MIVENSSTPIPPAVPDAREFTAHHDQLLHSVLNQLAEVTERLDALEAEVRSEAAPGAPASAAAPTKPVTPTWRTKTGRQPGWQPARR